MGLGSELGTCASPLSTTLAISGSLEVEAVHCWKVAVELGASTLLTPYFSPFIVFQKLRPKEHVNGFAPQDSHSMLSFLKVRPLYRGPSWILKPSDPSGSHL